jgi:hypothetical protein
MTPITLRRSRIRLSVLLALCSSLTACDDDYPPPRLQAHDTTRDAERRVTIQLAPGTALLIANTQETLLHLSVKSEELPATATKPRVVALPPVRCFDDATAPQEGATLSDRTFIGAQVPPMGEMPCPNALTDETCTSVTLR